MPVIYLAVAVGFLAVTRLTRLFVEDRITIGIRRWAVKKWGEDSNQSYFVHCPWCTSMWIAPLVMIPVILWPYPWVIALAAIPAASYVAGFFAGKE